MGLCSAGLGTGSLYIKKTYGGDFCGTARIKSTLARAAS